MNKLLSLFLILFICTAHAQIYKWIDNQGNVHFSDTPHEGAQRIDIPTPENYSTPPAPKTTKPERHETAPHHEDKAANDEVNYSKIEIIEPTPESTIRNNEGAILIQVEVEPELGNKDQLQLIMDGAALGKPQKEPVFNITGIYRGAHTLAVAIVNPEGHVVLKSDSVSVYMQRPRVGMGNTK